MGLTLGKGAHLVKQTPFETCDKDVNQTKPCEGSGTSNRVANQIDGMSGA